MTNRTAIPKTLTPIIIALTIGGAVASGAIPDWQNRVVYITVGSRGPLTTPVFDLRDSADVALVNARLKGYINGIGSFDTSVYSTVPESSMVYAGVRVESCSLRTQEPPYQISGDLFCRATATQGFTSIARPVDSRVWSFTDPTQEFERMIITLGLRKRLYAIGTSVAFNFDRAIPDSLKALSRRDGLIAFPTTDSLLLDFSRLGLYTTITEYQRNARHFPDLVCKRMPHLSFSPLAYEITALEGISIHTMPASAENWVVTEASGQDRINHLANRLAGFAQDTLGTAVWTKSVIADLAPTANKFWIIKTTEGGLAAAFPLPPPGLASDLSAIRMLWVYTGDTAFARQTGVRSGRPVSFRSENRTGGSQAAVPIWDLAGRRVRSVNHSPAILIRTPTNGVSRRFIAANHPGRW